MLTFLFPQKKRFFSLVFIERDRASRATKAYLNGPYMFNRKQDALHALWLYVKGRLDGVRDLFIEDACGLGVDLLKFTADNDEPISYDEFEAVVSSVNSRQIQGIVNWYFDVMDDDLCECWFDLSEHVI